MLVTVDAGKVLRVRVTGSNSRGTVEALSEPTAAVAVPAVAPANTVKPAISGSAVVGVTLASTTGTWTGTAPIAFARQWMRCTSTATTSCTAIASATGVSYVLATADVARYLRLRVTASNTKGAVQVLSEPTAIVAAAGAGALLTASNGTWTGGAPMTFTVSWATCAPGSSTCYYNGAVGSTYTPPASTPVGSRIVVVVTAQNTVGVAYGQSMPTEPLAAAV